MNRSIIPPRYSADNYYSNVVGNFFNEVLSIIQINTTRASFNFHIEVKNDMVSFNKTVVKIVIDDVVLENGISLIEFKRYVTDTIRRAEIELVQRNFRGDLEVNIHINVPVEAKNVFVEFKEVDNRLSVPEVKEIIHSTSKKKGEVFTVVWSDNTETSVKLMKGTRVMTMWLSCTVFQLRCLVLKVIVVSTSRRRKKCLANV